MAVQAVLPQRRRLHGQFEQDRQAVSRHDSLGDQMIKP
jgi:hypothetical protein